MVLGYLVMGASAVGFGAPANLAANAPDPATACQKLATLANFPVTPTQIRLAKFNPNGTTSANDVPLPAHCQVQGIINKRVQQFFLDPQAVVDQAYRSIDVTTQTAKFLMDAYYGQHPNRSYFVGCSTGGRQGMVFSQNFPDYYDGIVAGDPVYDKEAIALTELWSVEAMQAITPAPIRTLPHGSPILYPAFPVADQNLFTSAVLEACDGLDGTIDGVIDNAPACWAKFDPAAFVFPNGQPLQCTGAKTTTCLSPAQINAIKKINHGPRNSLGQSIKAPASAAAHDPVDATVFGYSYDGGFMSPTGIPARKIGTPTSTPRDFRWLGEIPYVWLLPPNPSPDCFGNSLCYRTSGTGVSGLSGGLRFGAVRSLMTDTVDTDLLL